MRKTQISFGVEFETVLALTKEAQLVGMSFPAYCRQIVDRRSKPVVPTPEVPFSSSPSIRIYDQKTFAEFEDVRRRCEPWEVKLWLQHHPNFDPKAFTAKAARFKAKKPR